MSSESYLEKVKEGEIIFSEGEPGDCAYIVQQGEIRLLTLINGKQTCFVRLGEGELFGEMSLIDNQLRSATAIAACETELIVIPRDYVENKIDVSDKLVGMFLKVVLERYREMRIRLEKVARGSEITEEDTGTFSGVYDDDVHYTAERIQAENNIRNALEEKQFELFYQPVISLIDGSVCGCEALIRWRHPQRGLIPPGEFIGILEESGLIVPVGLWIIEEATQACKRFNEDRPDSPLFVSINLSGKQFENLQLVSDIRDVFQKTGVDPSLIKLEITETVLMSNPLRVSDSLHALKDLGVSIAIDDFGTGYSSFSYLHRFPIDVLKIDQSFVFTMAENSKSMAIVRTLCTLAQSLDMSIIAEGIERDSDAGILVDFGVDNGQGYYFSKPLPEAQFTEFLHDWQDLAVESLPRL